MSGFEPTRKTSAGKRDMNLSMEVARYIVEFVNETLVAITWVGWGGGTAEGTFLHIVDSRSERQVASATKHTQTVTRTKHGTWPKPVQFGHFSILPPTYIVVVVMWPWPVPSTSIVDCFTCARFIWHTINDCLLLSRTLNSEGLLFRMEFPSGRQLELPPSTTAI